MRDRAAEGLAHLFTDWYHGVIWKPVVLSAEMGELGLDEQLFAPHAAGRECGGERPSDPFFVVLPPLVGRVDAAEPGGQRP
jgi:hypothetical protein